MSAESVRRYEQILTQTCSIRRAPISRAADLDMQLGDYTLVVASVACLIVPLDIHDEILTVGSVESEVRRVFLPRGTDVLKHDLLTDSTTGQVWFVRDVTVEQPLRGILHHFEAIVEESTRAHTRVLTGPVLAVLTGRGTID